MLAAQTRRFTLARLEKSSCTSTPMSYNVSYNVSYHCAPALQCLVACLITWAPRPPSQEDVNLNTMVLLYFSATVHGGSHVQYGVKVDHLDHAL
eukprot:351801-Chlamydomonas_euryale.AAC.5